MSTPRRVPDLVDNKLTSLGEVGLRWLADLDDLVRSLERDWGITVGQALSGGSEAFVAEAVAASSEASAAASEDAAGEKHILKIGMPAMLGNTTFENEALALTCEGGKGYARLIRSDLTRRALLLERLGKPLESLSLPVQAQIEILCRTLVKTWVRLPADTPLLTGEALFAVFRDLVRGLAENNPAPFSPRVISQALRFCDTRAAAFDPRTAVLVHGDAHSGNLLQSVNGAAFKLIDPDGILGEPAYDLGVLMRSWPGELLPDPISLGQKRCAYLSYLTGVEPAGIWEWGFIQSVTTGLLLAKVGQMEEGGKMLRVAEVWLE